MEAVSVTPTVEPFSPDFMSLEELAARMGISIALAYQLARADNLPVPAIRPSANATNGGKGSRRYLFSRRAYEKLLFRQHGTRNNAD